MVYWAQKTALTWQIVLLACASLLVTACINEKENEQLPYYNTADFTPIFADQTGNKQFGNAHQIADFTFKNQYGTVITEKSIEGKIHVADFFFTSCGSICPKLTANMSKISEAFKADNQVVLLSYTVTPWIDSVKVLEAYAKRNKITNPNWHLLTGSKAAIYTLARNSYFAEEELGFTKDSTNFLHTEHFLLIDGKKRIRGIYNGTLELEAAQLIKDINLLKEENAGG